MSGGRLLPNTVYTIEIIVDSISGIYKFFISDGNGQMVENIPVNIQIPATAALRTDNVTQNIVTPPGCELDNLLPDVGRGYLFNLHAHNGIPSWAYTNHSQPRPPLDLFTNLYAEDTVTGIVLSGVTEITDFSANASVDTGFIIDGRYTDGLGNYLVSDGSYAQSSTASDWQASLLINPLIPSDSNNIPIDISFPENNTTQNWFSSLSVSYSVPGGIENKLEFSTDSGVSVANVDIDVDRTSLVFVYDGSNTKVYRDGLLLDTVDSGMGIIRNYYLGQSAQGTNSAFMNHNETFILNRAMTLAEVQEASTYLNTKWGV
jgi:hypothetical protein